MKIAITYMAVPIIFALVVAVSLAVVRDSSFYAALSRFIFSVPFYCAPYIVFAIIHLSLKLPSKFAHSGYVGSTLALLTIAAVWFLPPDQSGLPIQWMAYWPLSAILIVLFVGGSFVHSKLSNS